VKKMNLPVKTPQDWHDEAYKFWVDNQNYGLVAKKFGRSRSQIARVSKAFLWRERYLELKKKDDEILAGHLNLTVGDTRKMRIKYLHQKTLLRKELMDFHITLIREKRDATAEEIAQMDRLRKAIKDSDSKDLRDETIDLKENVHFNPPQGKVVIPDGESQGGFTVTGPTLIIMGPKDKKPITLQSKETENAGKEESIREE
jgi:hypothetical protein